MTKMGVGLTVTGPYDGPSSPMFAQVPKIECHPAASTPICHPMFANDPQN
ncbi:MAG: hypothetical protein RL151_1019 [Bacteroidota bacterium]